MGKINELILKSRELFIKEQVANIDKIVKVLFKYRLYKKIEDKKELKRFFHLIRGTSATLKLDSLSNLGKEYEDYLDSIENNNCISHQVFSNILKGLGCIHEEIEKLNEEYFSNESKEEKNTANIKPTHNNKKYSGNILVVDDDVVILDLLESVFNEEGYNVTTTSNPDNVIPILKKEKIDLIILDVIMPEKDGFEILNQIREENFNIPIIFLTAKNITEDKVKALKAGVDDYITKPFQIEELIARVEAIVKKFNNYKKRMIKDNLTGVYNKKYFSERLEQLRNVILNKSQIFSIAFIDLDYFKNTNDKYGHLAGDYILKRFVEELKLCLRDSDEIYRFGGDEFLILFNDTSGEKAYDALERVRTKIKNKEFHYKEKNDNIPISFSAGISSVLDNDEDVESILERADKALYMSKQSGRGKTTHFENLDNKKKKILIIDDSNIIAHMIKTMLLSLNYDVSHASDGEEGVKLSKEIKPDVIILDLVLPKLDGFGVCKKVKSDLDTKNAKILILSSNCNEEDVLRCFKEGANDYMIKPFSLIDLEDRIKRLLK